MTNVENIRLGDNDIAFVRKGNEVIWPQYAGRENMVLWYDFSGRRNTDTQREIAEDLSGNGNDGTLNGFAYEEGSGYDDGLVFDGVDDYVQGNAAMCFDSTNFSMEFVWRQIEFPTGGWGGFGTFGNLYATIVFSATRTFRILYRGDVAQFNPNVSFNLTPFNIDKNVFNSYTVNFNNDQLTIELYVNGSIIGIAPMDGRMLGEKDISKSRLSVENNKYVKNSIKSFRKYNRILTPSEIQTNYLIDKQRFNLP